jgi:hypothetical protein
MLTQNIGTYVKYGGSGLGLFISKSLSELQGGGIGISSKFGQGSTFAFYVKARITEPPSTDGSLHRLEPTPFAEVTTSIRDVLKAAHCSVLIVEDNIVNASQPIQDLIYKLFH